MQYGLKTLKISDFKEIFIFSYCVTWGRHNDCYNLYNKIRKEVEIMQLINKVKISFELKQMLEQGLIITVDGGYKITKRGLAYKEFLANPYISEENKTYEHFIQNYYKECIIF